MFNFRHADVMRLAVLGAVTWGASSLVVPPPRALAQSVRCLSVSERTSELGCWILGHQSVGKLTSAQNYWQLDNYISRKAAEDAKGPRGVVVESMRKIWLLSIEEAGWRAPGGERVAEIGPLPITPGEEYSSQYMEAIFTPGMTSSVHLHGGPAPVRRFLPELIQLIWDRTIDPGVVFDLTLPLERAAEGYRAMDERLATKVLLTG